MGEKGRFGGDLSPTKGWFTQPKQFLRGGCFRAGDRGTFRYIRGMPDTPSTLPDSLRAEIARRGPLPFVKFMEKALYAPDAGYYSAGRAVIGRRGDYFTNVSVGPLFGTLLARQFAEMWEQLRRP